jgi:hypothetical protein
MMKFFIVIILVTLVNCINYYLSRNVEGIEVRGYCDRIEHEMCTFDDFGNISRIMIDSEISTCWVDMGEQIEEITVRKWEDGTTQMTHKTIGMEEYTKKGKHDVMCRYLSFFPTY